MVPSGNMLSQRSQIVVAPIVTGYSHDGHSVCIEPGRRTRRDRSGQGIVDDRCADETGADPISVLPDQVGQRFPNAWCCSVGASPRQWPVRTRSARPDIIRPGDVLGQERPTNRLGRLGVVRSRVRVAEDLGGSAGESRGAKDVGGGHEILAGRASSAGYSGGRSGRASHRTGSRPPTGVARPPAGAAGLSKLACSRTDPQRRDHRTARAARSAPRWHRPRPPRDAAPGLVRHDKEHNAACMPAPPLDQPTRTLRSRGGRTGRSRLGRTPGCPVQQSFVVAAGSRWVPKEVAALPQTTFSCSRLTRSSEQENQPVRSHVAVYHDGTDRGQVELAGPALDLGVAEAVEGELRLPTSPAPPSQM